MHSETSFAHKAARLLKTSRPRFWLYFAGPFLVGFGASAQSLNDFSSWKFWVPLLFFTIPANFFVYGINDLYDEDTDQFNAKKEAKEQRLQKIDKLLTKVGVAKSIVLGVALAMTLTFVAEASKAGVALIAFLLVGALYSMPPVRFKARPFFDSISNIFYILPGVVGFALNGNMYFSANIFVACGCWAIAMHLFSAIPDIEADKKARLNTTAIILGKKYSLLACSILWAIFAVLLIKTTIFFPWSIILIAYPITALFLINKGQGTIERAYWKFPILNALIGFLWFLAASTRLL